MDASDLIDLTPLRPRRRSSSREADVHATPTSMARALREHVDDGDGAATYEAQAYATHHMQRPYATAAEEATAAGSTSWSAPPPPSRREDLSYIWGTGIAIELFRDEVRHYLEHSPAPATGSNNNSNAHTATTMLATTASREAYYVQELVHMHLQGRRALEIDMTHMQHTAPALYARLVHHPTECLQLMAAVVEELYRDVLAQRYAIAVADDVVLTVAPRHLPSLVTLKALSPHHVEQLLSLRGMVIRVSRVIPEIRVACFRCWNCQHIERSVSEDKGRIFEPTRCTHCGTAYSFALQHNLSLYEDKQLIKLQESPEHVSDGETPISISVVVYGSLVDAVVPGDRVVVTGVYRATPIRVNANTRIVKSVFATHVDALHLEHTHTATRLAAMKQQQQQQQQQQQPQQPRGAHHVRSDPVSPVDTASGLLSTGRLDTLHAIARRPDVYDILLRSFAPAVWGHEDVKRGILAQLFGGTHKTLVFDHAQQQQQDEQEQQTTMSAHEEGDDGQATRHRQGRRRRRRDSEDDDGRVHTTTPHRHDSSHHHHHHHSSSSSSNGAMSFRAELNIILCGDPGVAKSQLLTYVHQIAPRGVYTSGKGSSSVGLTAFVVQDTDTGEFVLEPGALVLSDKGLCCIDEFDKMNDATRAVLHEVMEQQTLSVAKAGIVAQLNARTSILAAANPRDSRWNAHLSVVDNLQLEPTLLSRFDLIFVLLDRHDAAEDRRLAAHVLDMYVDPDAAKDNNHNNNIHNNNDDDDDDEDGTTTTRKRRARDADDGDDEEVVLAHAGEVFLTGPAAAPRMPAAILSEYIAVARDTVSPQLSEAAHRALAAAYVDLRRARGGSSGSVSATLRQLESMIRLAEAHAKMRYAAVVDAHDVAEAARLMRAALKEAATDPRTGRINLDIFHAPDPTRNTVEGSLRRLVDVIERVFAAHGRRTVPLAELRNAYNERLTGGARALTGNALVELLALCVGGDHVESFTATTVTLAHSALQQPQPSRQEQ